MRYYWSFLAAAAVTLSVGLVTGHAQAPYGDPSQLTHAFYQQFLGRPADPVGLSHSVRFLHCGGDPAALQVTLLSSEEFFHRHGCTPQGFIAGLYQTVLGRAPDPQGLNDWTWRLQLCGHRARIATEFLTAAQCELAERAAAGQPVAVPGTQFPPAYTPPTYAPPAYTPPGLVPPPVPDGERLVPQSFTRANSLTLRVRSR